MDFFNRHHASQPSRRGSEVANSQKSKLNVLDENRILRGNNQELERQHGELQKHIAGLKQELAAKNVELSRVVPVPYGSYCSSGATPQLLARYSEKVLIDLGNFVLFSVPSETPNETVNSLKACVSEIFFSKFEQTDFGLKGEKFTNPGLLPEQSFKEFGAFLAYSDYPEAEAMKAVKPYMPKYERFLEYKKEKIKETCSQGESRVEFNDASSAHFCSLAMNVWMLHKLTLSFERAIVRLMRVVHEDNFIHEFMQPVGPQDENQLKGKPPATTTTVKYVILPGLWINHSVIKCRVCLGSASDQDPSNAPAAQLGGGDALNGTGPRSVDVTPKQAQQPTSSQVPDSEAPAVHVHAHQQTRPMEYTMTDERHVFEVSHSRLPDEELGSDKIPAVDVDQAAQEMTSMDITKKPLEDLVEEPPLQPPYSATVMENYYYPPSSTHFAHQGNGPNPYHGSAHQS